MPRAKKRSEDWRGQVLMDHAPKKGRVESEASVLKRVREALEIAGGCKVMRNSCGLARHGRRRIPYGLEKGSSDLVCIVAPFGRWLCIETKRGDGGDQAAHQEQWLRTMRGYGAVADFCTTPERALELLQLARRPAFEDEG